MAKKAKADMRRALVRKHKKLAGCQTLGARTLLLLDVPETWAFHDYFWRLFRELADEIPHGAYDEVMLAGSFGTTPYFERRAEAIARLTYRFGIPAGLPGGFR